jgi:hypothetical protein
MDVALFDGINCGKSTSAAAGMLVLILDVTEDFEVFFPFASSQQTFRVTRN